MSRALAKGSARATVVIDAVMARPEHAWSTPAAPKK